MAEGVWESLPGQERAVELLRHAAARPSHAYLVSGPEGAGTTEAARSFAAALLCGEEARGCGECRHCTRVLRGRHPDVVEVEPDGSEIRVEQAAGIIEAAFHSPVEAARKVVIVHESERMNEAAANKLLKTLEEPPEPTVFVLLTSAPDELLPTVRSRCQHVALAAAGAAAARAARLSGPLAGLAEAFRAVPFRVDGTGAAAAVLAGELSGAIDDALARLKAEHVREQDDLEAELGQAGYADRVARRMRKALATRHERAERRARTDALAEGLGILEAAYRDALVGAPAAPAVGAASALAALDAVAEARRAVQEGIVLNWGLLLEDLLLNLPGAARPTDTLAPQASSVMPAPE